MEMIGRTIKMENNTSKTSNNSETNELKLYKSISNLRFRAAKYLEFFELNSIHDWNPSNLGDEDIKKVLEAVNNLESALQDYSLLDEEEVGSYKERIEKRAKLEELEAKIHQNFELATSVIAGNIGTDVDSVDEVENAQSTSKGINATVQPAEEDEEDFATLLEKAEEVDATSANEEKTTGEIIEQPKPAIYHNLSKEIAKKISESNGNSDVNDWNQLIYALICDNDLAGAYWIVSSLEQADGYDGLSVPSWILAAIQGSRWLASEHDAMVIDLLELSQNAPSNDKTINLLSLSAAINPALIAPYSGLIGWLQGDPGLQSVRQLVEKIKEFASLGISVDAAVMENLYGAEKSKSSFTEVIQTAKIWVNDAPQKRAKIKRASDVWRHLTSHDSELMQMIIPVASDDRSKRDEVEELCQKWREQAFIYSKIDEVDSKVFKVKSRPIVGTPRDQILRDVQEACSIAWRWSRMAQFESDTKNDSTWMDERLSELRSAIIPLAKSCLSDLDELRTPAQPLNSRAAANALIQAIIQLMKTMRISEPTEFKNDVAWDWFLQKPQELSLALNLRLLFIPGINLDNEGYPKIREKSLAFSICNSIEQDLTIQQICQIWIDQQDFRFIEKLSVLDSEDFVGNFDEAIMLGRADLSENKGKIQNAIEQALIDGIITEEKRSELNYRVEQIYPELTLNLHQYYLELEAIQIVLSTAREERIFELQKDWERLQLQLNTSRIVSEEKKAKISKLITRSFENSDSRLVDEYLARLSAGIENSNLQDDDWEQDNVDEDIAEIFFRDVGVIQSWLEKSSLDQVSSEIRDAKTSGGYDFNTVEAPRRSEAAKAIDAWRQLKKIKGRQTQDLQGLISNIVEYLGFVLDTNTHDPIVIKKNGDDFIYLNSHMSALDNNRPIPQFGSQTSGLYHIVCLWERPGAGTIHSRLLDLRLNTENVLVFFFGRITERQRQDLIRVNSSQDLSIAVLDDVLLAFLAREHDIRLPAFLKCALPLAAINPYTPFKAGDVPPEMFFGRGELIRELNNPNGSCIVYGGRQLGKSALLRQVYNTFNNKEKYKFAKVEDIKLVGTDSKNMDTRVIWKRIRESFKEFGLIPEGAKTDKPDDIEILIRDCMLKNPQLQVLLLFDEADNFLEADSRKSFAMTDMLRALMTDTGRRLKVVFAGLHSVQRFQELPNQPLAHFGTPILVGPLEPKDATELIRLPLFYLGYRFSDTTGPLRILSYTNYHPGLIQLFCQELLNRMRKRSNRRFPFQITQTDIEVIYQQLKDQIKERFDWTLALDPAYQSIAWSLAENQMAARDGFSQSYSPHEILGIVRYWWKGFPNDLQLIRGLLKEMVGLGVLVKDQAGKYRLRSPNLVRLMGTENEIGEQLLQLAEKREYLPVSDNNVLHTPFDDQATEYSPLTYSQEGSLNFKSHGVGLIFASKASGLDKLPTTLRAVSDTDEYSVMLEIPLYVSDKDDLNEYLDREIAKNKDKNIVSFYHQLTGSNIKEIEEIITSGIEYCNKARAKNRILRLYFILDQKSTRLWFRLPQETRITIENKLNALVYPIHWNNEGIKERLKQKNKLDNPNVTNLIMAATGGWHYLVETLFTKGETNDDLRSIAKQMTKEIKNSASEFSINLKEYLGLSINDVEKKILNLMMEYSSPQKETGPLEIAGIEIEFLSPEFLNDATISQEECDSALEALVRLGCVHLEQNRAKIDPVLAEIIRTK